MTVYCRQNGIGYVINSLAVTYCKLRFLAINNIYCQRRYKRESWIQASYEAEALHSFLGRAVNWCCSSAVHFHSEFSMNSNNSATITSHLKVTRWA